MTTSIKSILALLIFLLLNNVNVQAQQKKYVAEYKKILAFEKKGLTKNALAEAKKIFDDALKTNNEPEQIKAAMYQMRYNTVLNDENQLANYTFLQNLAAKTKAPAKNILLSMQAQLLNDFKENIRYKLYSRTALINDDNNDINTWSLAKLNTTIMHLYKASLTNEVLLKATKTKQFDAIIIKGKNTENLRPTLYDLLAHRLLDYCSNTENDVTNAANKFIINDEVAFGTVAQFATHTFTTKDTSSQYYTALTILQALINFHLKHYK